GFELVNNNIFHSIKHTDGKEEIFYAFLEAVAPEIDLFKATAPEPDSTLLWSVRDASTNQSVPLTPPHLLPFLSWDGAKPWQWQTAGLYGGWFVVQTGIPDTLVDDVELIKQILATALTQGDDSYRQKIADIKAHPAVFGVDPAALPLALSNGVLVATGVGTAARTLELGIGYKDCDGKERQAYRMPGNAFVSVPLGTKLDDVDLTQTTLSTELKYQDWDGNCRIAQIHRPPTATITAVNGTLLEGAAMSFSGTGSSP